jgi:hypothetical protein
MKPEQTSSSKKVDSTGILNYQPLISAKSPLRDFQPQAQTSAWIHYDFQVPLAESKHDCIRVPGQTHGPRLVHHSISIEEIEDADVLNIVHENWDGESTFWMCNDMDCHCDNLKPEDCDEDSGGWESEDEDYAIIDVEDEMVEEVAFNLQRRAYIFAPTPEEAAAAFADIKNIIKPPRNKGYGYKNSGLDRVTRTHLEGVQMFLGAYVCLETDRPGHQGNWTEASHTTAVMHCETVYHAKKLHEWAQSFINDRKEIPENNYGKGSRSAIDDDEDFAQEIHLHLQGIGKYIKAENIVQYCAQAEVLMRLKRTKTISLSTARRWLQKWVTAGRKIIRVSTLMGMSAQMWSTTDKACFFL